MPHDARNDLLEERPSQVAFGKLQSLLVSAFMMWGAGSAPAGVSPRRAANSRKSRDQGAGAAKTSRVTFRQRAAQQRGCHVARSPV